MDETEDDDFGGFEVADADSEPVLVENDSGVGADVGVSNGPDVSAIPWLAASIQATSNESSLFGADPSTLAVNCLDTNIKSVFDLNETTKPSGAIKQDAVVVDNNTAETPLVSELNSKLETALEEKQAYRSETIELKEKQEANRQRVKHLEAELEDQKKRYEDLQAKHLVELEELRKANSTALSVVTEEYKESMKLSILEQQKACSQLFTEQIDREWCKVENILQQQTEKFEAWKTEFNKSLNETHAEEMAKLRQEVEEEKEKLRETFKQELHKTNEHLVVLRTESSNDIQAELAKRVSELQLTSKELVGQATEELKESMKSQSKLISDQERTISMDYWEKQSSKMAETLQQSTDAALKAQRESMNEYISQHIQADQLSQKKHLSAVNVYLEAATKHIAAITDPDVVS